MEGDIWWPPRMPEADCQPDINKVIPEDSYDQFLEQNPLFVHMPEPPVKTDQELADEAIAISQLREKHLGEEEQKESSMHQNQIKVIDYKNASANSAIMIAH
jgi:hypothetical protein